jgi:hypothetical protein
VTALAGAFAAADPLGLTILGTKVGLGVVRQRAAADFVLAVALFDFLSLHNVSLISGTADLKLKAGGLYSPAG